MCQGTTADLNCSVYATLFVQEMHLNPEVMSQ